MQCGESSWQCVSFSLRLYPCEPATIPVPAVSFGTYIGTQNHHVIIDHRCIHFTQCVSAAYQKIPGVKDRGETMHHSFDASVISDFLKFGYL